MSVELEITEFRTADTEALARFFEANDREETRDVFHPFPLNRHTVETRIACAGRDRYYVAWKDNGVVGFFMLRGWDDGYSVPSFGVLVDFRWRGRGVGKMLTAYAVSEAERLGCERIRLSVYASHQRALKMYRAFGFREVKREEAGPKQDRVRLVMIKDLRAPARMIHETS